MSVRVTMATVAKAAGVHVTTVSLALRNHPSLPEATRDRLRLLAKELGYQPDPALQALVAYRRKTRPRKGAPPLAYITNWGSRWGWKLVDAHGDFYAGATAKAQELGYGIEHFWLGERDLTHQRMSDILTARGITGVIIASHNYDVDVPLRFDWPKFSAVKIDFFPHLPQLHNVTNDQRAIVQLAMRQVIAAGYRRIGFVMLEGWNNGVDLAWTAGFLAEQHTLSAAERIPMFITRHVDEHAEPAPPFGYPVVPADTFKAWYRQHRPEVLISHAPFVQPHLDEMGICVPRDLAFVDVFLQELDGRIAGVRHNCRRVGEIAVEILAGQLQHHSFGIPEFPTATFVEGTWFEGASLPARVSATSPQKLSLSAGA